MDIPNQKKILFVEDDATLGFVVKDHLSLEGYDIEWIKDGQTAFEVFEDNEKSNSTTFDLCIFDVMLPKLDGFELAKKVRVKNKNIPILFLTAKSLQEDRLHALRIGADDYLTKPFSIEELVLKMEIFLRRSAISSIEILERVDNQSTIQLGKYIFDAKNLSLVSPSQKKYSLTTREVELLNLFCQNKEQVLRREFILKQLWGDDDYFLGRSLDVFISRLRKYLKEDENITIENIPRVGFKLVVRNN